MLCAGERGVGFVLPTHSRHPPTQPPTHHHPNAQVPGGAAAALRRTGGAGARAADRGGLQRGRGQARARARPAPIPAPSPRPPAPRAVPPTPPPTRQPTHNTPPAMSSGTGTSTRGCAPRRRAPSTLPLSWLPLGACWRLTQMPGGARTPRRRGFTPCGMRRSRTARLTGWVVEWLSAWAGGREGGWEARALGKRRSGVRVRVQPSAVCPPTHPPTPTLVHTPRA